MEHLPTDVHTIFIQYVSAIDIFNLSKMNKKHHQRIWNNANVWTSKKLSLHKERSIDIPEHLLYYCGKKPLQILRHAAKYGHDLIFLPLFRSLLNILRKESVKIRENNPRIYVEFDEIHQEICHTLDYAYYDVLISPYTDMLLTLLEETINFVPNVNTQVDSRSSLTISYTNLICKKDPSDTWGSHDISYGLGTCVVLAIFHEKYDAARMFLRRGLVRIPRLHILSIRNKLLIHSDIYLEMLRQDQSLIWILLQECHKLARIDILDNLTNTSEHTREFVIYRPILKKLIKERKYDYIMHFMKVCYIKTIRDIAELADDKLREKIRKNKKLMRLKNIGTKFANKSDSDSADDSEPQFDDVCRGKTRTGKNCTRKVTDTQYCWQHRK